MMANDAPKAKTNWNMIIWPTLVLWTVAAIYVDHSEFRGQAGLVLPLLMVAALGMVLVANAIAGSAQQRQLNLQYVFGDVTQCMQCGRSDVRLELIQTEYSLFLYAHTFSWYIRGKFCRECAVKIVNKAFIKNGIGCILCPPLILFSWWNRNKLLKKFDPPPDRPIIRDYGNSSTSN